LLRLTRPTEIYSGWNAFAFPSGHAAINAAVYGFLAVVVASEIRPSGRAWILASAALFVSLIAFSRLYLGVHWLSDVMAGLSFAVAWVALLGIAYCHRERRPVGAVSLFATVLLTICVIGGLHIARDHAADVARYAVRSETRTMTLSDWWQARWTDLPTRRIDLTGETEEPITVQWVGRPDELKLRLIADGWRVPVRWSRRSGFAWLGSHANLAELPVIPQLQNGYRELLTLVHAADGPEKRLVLRLWQSDAVIQDGAGAVRPLLIGTVVEERLENVDNVLTVNHTVGDVNAPRDLLGKELARSRLARRGDHALSKGWDGSILLSYDPQLLLPSP
jgi:undecaprenyl-diphosphatase